MIIELNETETRVIACLLEKETTTPDQYPLSLNALVNACNQKSNRDPVMSLDATSVQDCLDELSKKRLVSQKSGYGSRVEKYQHRFCNTEFSTLQLSEQERAIVCVLMLRGPQTAGELRTRTNRLCAFGDVREVETVLDGMANRPGDDPYVVRLAREPGRRECRYAQLFSGPLDASVTAATDVSMSSPRSAPADNPGTAAANSPFSDPDMNPGHGQAATAQNDRLARLEREMSMLRDEVAELRRLLTE